MLYLLHHSTSYLLKDACQYLSSLIVPRECLWNLTGYVLSELLIDLLSDSRGPPHDLVVNKLHFLIQLFSLLTFLLEVDDLNI